MCKMPLALWGDKRDNSVMDIDVTQSRYYMWRTLFALTHIDGIVTDEEIDFMRGALGDVSFSVLQRQQLCEDMAEPQNIYFLFEKVTDLADKQDFFTIAQDVVNVDGIFCTNEREALEQLKAQHIQADVIEKLSQGLQFDDKPKSFTDIKISIEATMKKNDVLLFKVLQRFYQRKVE